MQQQKHQRFELSASQQCNIPNGIPVSAGLARRSSRLSVAHMQRKRAITRIPAQLLFVYRAMSSYGSETPAVFAEAPGTDAVMDSECECQQCPFVDFERLTKILDCKCCNRMSTDWLRRHLWMLSSPYTYVFADLPIRCIHLSHKNAWSFLGVRVFSSTCLPYVCARAFPRSV